MFAECLSRVSFAPPPPPASTPSPGAAAPSTPTTRSAPRCQTAVRDATTCVPIETDGGTD